MSRRTALLLAWIATAAPGCAALKHDPAGLASQLEAHADEADSTTGPSADPAPPVPPEPQNPSSEPAASRATPAAATTQSAPPSVKEIRASALTEIAAELNSLGSLDPAAQRQLLADLEQTDPAVWPQLLEVFRASVAYQKRLTGRGGADSPPVPSAGASSAEIPPGAPAPQASATAARADAPAASPASLPAALADTAAPTPVAGPPAPEPAATAASDPPVVVASHAAPSTATSPTVPGVNPAVAKESTATPDKPAVSATDPDAWKLHIARAIESLEHQTAEPAANAQEVGRQAALRMLYVVAERRDDSLRPITGAPPAQQDFWSKEIYGLATYLDAERNPDPARRAAEAGAHLREAASRLGELATLHVRNLAFCTEVTSYGVYKTFDKLDFIPGQEVLLYAEVENFKSESSEKGYHTALSSSYEILDARGARVAEHEFALTEEYCQNPRRDFFIRYFVWLPKRIYGGKYTLQLTIEDTLSHKIGQASIEFSVKAPE